MQCIICSCGGGESRRLATGCILRADIERSFGVSLLVSVTTLNICYQCCLLIELWDGFATKVRKNLNNFIQHASTTRRRETAAHVLTNEVQQLSQMLQHVLAPSTETEDNQASTNQAILAETVKQEDVDPLDISTAAASNQDEEPTRLQWVIKSDPSTQGSQMRVGTITKTCSVILFRGEVENYLKQTKQATEALVTSSAPTVIQDLQVENNSLSRSSSSLSNDIDASEPLLLSDGEISLNDVEENHISQASFFESGVASDVPSTSYTAVPFHGDLSKVDSSILKELVIDGNSITEECSDYVCEVCSDESFSSINYFLAHMVSQVHKDSVLKWMSASDRNKALEQVCKFCSQTFSNYNQFDKHIIECLGEQSSKFVNLKRKSLAKSSYEVGSEMEKRLKTDVFECDLCPQSCDSKSVIKKHILSHLKNFEHQNTDFKCNFCSKFYVNEKSLEEHSLLHMPKNVFKYPCCNINFTDKTAFDNHILVSGCWKKNKKTCNLCSFSTKKVYNLKRHLNNTHGIPIFENMSLLNKELRKIKKKVLNKSSSMLLSKTDKQSLIRPKSLKSEIKIASIRGEIISSCCINVYTCDICSEKCDSKSVLKKHIKHHLENIDDQNVENKCKFCSKLFENRELLNKHVFSHFSNSGFAYPCCGINFTKSSSLQLHISKSGCWKATIKKCNVCSFTSKWLNNLRRHLHNKHDIVISENAQYLEKPLMKSLSKTISTLSNTVEDDKTSFDNRILRYGCFKGAIKKCNLCSFNTKWVYNLQRHLNTVHKNISIFQNKPIKNELRKKFVNKSASMPLSSYNQSLVRSESRQSDIKIASKLGDQISSSNINVYTCNICLEMCDCKSVLEKHIKYHLEYKHEQNVENTCKICSTLFPNKSLLNKHIFSHFSKSGFSYPCCGINFTKNSSLQLHISKSGCWNATIKKCNLCSFTTKKLYNLHRHLCNLHDIVVFKNKLFQGMSHKKSQNISSSSHSNTVNDLHTGNLKCTSDIEKYVVLLSEKGLKILSCAICKFQTQYKFCLKRHIFATHTQLIRKGQVSEELDYLNAEENAISLEMKSCDLCSYKTNNRKLLVKHMHKTHIFKKKVISLCCSSCFCNFPNMYQLRLHKLSHNEREVPKFKCSICKESFLFFHKLQSHKKRAHSDFICETCGFAFTSYTFLRNHQSHHNKTISASCDICDLCFTDTKSLKEHVFWKHAEPSLKPKVEDNLTLLRECDFCSEVFGTENEFELHVREQHAVLDVPENDIESELAGVLCSETSGLLILPCFECEITYVDLTLLGTHCREEHSKTTNVRCKLCEPKSNTYKNYQNYIEHLRSCHVSKAILPLKCPKCSKKLSSLEKLLRHFGGSLPPGIDIKDCYSNQIKEKKKNPLKCEHCDNVYKSYTGLFKHKRDYHPEIKKFKCEDCNKMFFLECKFRKHRMFKHEKKTFKCSYCDEVKITKRRLLHHMQQFHKDKSVLHCSICNVNFSTLIRAENHAEKHKDDRFVSHPVVLVNEFTSHDTDNSKMLEHCGECEMKFVSKYERQIHNFTYHMKVPCYSCKLCGRVAATIKLWKMHYTVVHEKVKRIIPSQTSKSSNMNISKCTKYKCNICKMKFVYLLQYQNHVSSHKNETLCTFCGKTLPKQMLAKHLKLCQIRNYKFACKKCPKKFILKKEFKTHNIFAHKMRLDKVQICQHCKRTCHNHYSLSLHYMHYHNELHPLPLQCGYCEFQCVFDKEFSDHISRHDSRLVHCEQCKNDISLRDYTRSHVLLCSKLCQICGVQHEEKLALLSHVAQHKTALFYCELCKNYFPSLQNLEAHKKNLHGTYNCDFCKINLSYKCSLTNHIKWHLKSEVCKICSRAYISKSKFKKHALQSHSNCIPENVLSILQKL